jgi:pimeloyl-ACP methyl ester carboxylesterase
MKYKNILRARFKSGIVAEFLPPERRSNKVVILCDGLPTVPAKRKLIQFFSQRGFWAFHMRYRGTWESSGSFLREPPSKDIALLIKELKTGFKEAWGDERFQIKDPQITVLGSSFGGTAAIFASLFKEVRKAVALSPGCDIDEPLGQEALRQDRRIIERAFGVAYRYAPKDWKKLESGRFFNPALIKAGIDPRKLLVVHTRDDSCIPFSQSEEFCRRHGLNLVALNKGGHMSASDVTQPRLWRRVSAFIR